MGARIPPFSFVHAADLHLDSPFVGLGRLPKEQSGIVDDLRNATFRAFDAVIDICIREEVDFLLVAGDVYDGADRSLQAQLRFRDGLRKLHDADIRTYFVHGNHDPLDGWAHRLEWPEGVHQFEPELKSVVFEKDGVAVARIHGISYPTRKIDEGFGRGFQREGAEPFQIGLLHCNAGGNTQHDPYAPRSESDLVDTKLDYWALGHIHESMVLRKADPFIGYPGNTQGRHIKEHGPRGCFLVRVTAQGELEADPVFVATDVVRWFARDVDIEGMDTMMDSLFRCIEAEMDDLSREAEGRPVVARITVSGRGPLHRSLTKPNAAKELLDELHNLGTARKPYIWVEKLVLRTRPTVDLDARRGAKDFLGDLLQLIEDVRRSPAELTALRGALADLYEHGRASKILDPPDEDAILAMLRQAESTCVDLLVEDND